MGKAKKGRKVDQEEDVDGTISGDAENAPDEEVASKAKAKKEKKVKEPVVESESDDDQQRGKKKKGKKKEKANDEVDEATLVLEEMSISSKPKKEKKKGKTVQVDSDDEAPAVEKNKKSSKKKGKKKGSDGDSENEEAPKKQEKGGFALLAVSDDEAAPEKQETDSDNDTPVQVKKDVKETKKGGKKSKRNKKEDDEDLDQILAELELEYSGNAPPKEEPKAEPATEEKEEKEESKKSKKAKKKEEKAETKQDSLEAPLSGGEEVEVPGIKTAAEKKKEKKEREKQKRLAEKAKTQQSAQSKPERSSETPEVEAKPEEKPAENPEDDEDEEDKDDKKKKKKKKGKEEKEKGKGVPNKKTIAAMQEALRKIKVEEERMAAEEAERLKMEEEKERARLEQLRLEQERKDRKKAKEKERKERLKAEGKLLNSKQKADRARAEAMIEAMKAMYGNAAPGGGAPKPKPFTKLKKKKPQDGSEPEADAQEENHVAPQIEEPAATKVEVEIVDAKEEVKEEEVDVGPVKDSWDAESSGDEGEKSEESVKKKAEEESAPSSPVKGPAKKRKDSESVKEDSESERESSETEESESESESESEDEEEERGKTDAEKKRERALARIKERQQEAERNRSLNELRAAVVCVLGHVDTGKTKILDKLRRTHVQDSEAGGITQQIGATNVPIEAIQEQAKIVKGFSSMEMKIPGLLIIDTPGHESFSNLRSRGSSLCDVAILVVDIMHGLEPQTIESLNLLKQRKTPFVVALNKIDRLYDWQTMARRDVRDIIKAQAQNTQLEFEQRVNDVILQFAEQGMNAALFYENPDVRSYISLVPTSAITGEGMGNLLAYIVECCQTMLAKRLMFSEELQATVLEVKAISGLGTTIDVILVNGRLREGDTVVLAGTEAPIVTQIRSLLMPQPLKELRVKSAYVDHKEVKAAQGVKIAAKDLEKVIAGLNLRVAVKPDEVDILREEVGRELKHALSAIKLQERGVYVQASTLGSLEALLEFLKTSSIPYSGIRIGPVVKKDVVKASTMLEHDSQYATILAFDVKIERDAQDLADTLGVKIFQADIIYHLFDKFMAYRDELKQKKRDEFKSIAVFPCRLRILPQFVFNSRDPIVIGVIVEAGIVKEGTPICVPSKEFVDIGFVTSIESNHKAVESARKGQEVCIKIEPVPGEAPKMFGRHFDEKDFLVSKISRQSIDACKDYFREDLAKTDWQLMVELKKLFQIL